MMYKWFRRSKSLSQHIKLDDQTLSRTDAVVGSMDGSYATLDLSSASDSVSLNLVKGVFAGTDYLLRLLVCTRSKYTQLSKSHDNLVIRLKKFAPMGSAVCFTTMTLILSAVCELAKRRRAQEIIESGLTRGRNPTMKDVFRDPDWRSDLHYRVYGDDIVIGQGLVSIVLEILRNLHFEVNAEKSFADCDNQAHFFREACGIEALNGMDVTAVRVPRFFKGTYGSFRHDARSLDSTIDFLNTVFDNELKELRNAILQDMHDTWKALRFDTRGDHHIKTWDYCCTNYHLTKRFRQNVSGNAPCYQEPEVRSLCVELCRDCATCRRAAQSINSPEHCPRTVINDQVRYFEWLKNHRPEIDGSDEERLVDGTNIIEADEVPMYCVTSQGFSWKWESIWPWDPDKKGLKT